MIDTSSEEGAENLRDFYELLTLKFQDVTIKNVGICDNSILETCSAMSGSN